MISNMISIIWYHMIYGPHIFSVAGTLLKKMLVPVWITCQNIVLFCSRITHQNIVLICSRITHQNIVLFCSRITHQNIVLFYSRITHQNIVLFCSTITCQNIVLFCGLEAWKVNNAIKQWLHNLPLDFIRTPFFGGRYNRWTNICIYNIYIVQAYI